MLSDTLKKDPDYIYIEVSDRTSDCSKFVYEKFLKQAERNQKIQSTPQERLEFRCFEIFFWRSKLRFSFA